MKQIRGIWLPDDDRHFEEHILAGPEFEDAGTYQFKKIEMALRVCSKRRVALDIGAHVGLWSRVLRRHFDEVLAFEPIVEYCECFIRNARADNVILYQRAVSDRCGELEMRRVRDNSGNTYVAKHGETATRKVHSIRIDDECFKDVDLIKIDVEGWEAVVLNGAEETIRRDKPVVIVEQKPGNAERYGMGRLDASNLLEDWGASLLWEKSGDRCYGWD